MKKVSLTICLLFCLSFANSYTAYEASFHVGEDATVCGKVVGTYYAKKSKGEPTFLNLDKAYPNQVFTIVIWGEDRTLFKNPQKRYKGKNICVTGYIESFRGVPQITVRTPSQIKQK